MEKFECSPQNVKNYVNCHNRLIQVNSEKVIIINLTSDTISEMLPQKFTDVFDPRPISQKTFDKSFLQWKNNFGIDEGLVKNIFTEEK